MYTIIPNKEANLLLEKHHGKEVYLFEIKAAAFQLDNGKYIILPPYTSDKSLLFESKKEYDSFAANPIFPVTDTGYFFRYSDAIKNIDKSREIFYDDMNKILDANFKKIETEDDLKKLFVAINKKIQTLNLKSADINDEFQNGCFVLIGDYLHYAYNCRWISKIQYFNFQTFYTPHIVAFEKNSALYDWEFMNLRGIINDMTKRRHFDYFFFKKQFDYSLKIHEANFNKRNPGEGVIIPPFK